MARHIVLRYAGTAVLVAAVSLALFAFPTTSQGGGLPAGAIAPGREGTPTSTTIEVPIAASSDDAGINAASGNALAIIAQNAGTATGTWRHRRVIGYDRPEWYPGSEYAARLVVTNGEQPSPPSPAPDWSAYGGQEDAWLGYTAATAGDVNGDGYTDVIVGAFGYDNGQADEGAAFVYHGGPDGLSATADWMTEGAHQYSAHYGMIASAGDVNGDGYADVAVGEPDYAGDQWDEGRAYVYYGSAAGLSPIANWTAEGDQDGAKFGGFAGTVGDVNGDGYADLVVGDTNYTSVQWRDGRAYAYYGNHGGLSLRPQQRRSDDSAPIAYLGMSDQRDAFRLALLGRTPFGRGKVKLEWEVKPLGVLFDGTGRQRSAEWIDTGTAGAQLGELVDSLQENTLYHWRVGLLYHPATTPFQQTSRWITTPWNGWNEARLRTGGPPEAVVLTSLSAAARERSPAPAWLVAAIVALALAGSGALLRRRDSATRW